MTSYEYVTVPFFFSVYFWSKLQWMDGVGGRNEQDCSFCDCVAGTAS